MRGLEKRIDQIMRKSVVAILKRAKTPVTVTAKNLKDYLGAPIFEPEKPRLAPGVVTGPGVEVGAGEAAPPAHPASTATSRRRAVRTRNADRVDMAQGR